MPATSVNDQLITRIYDVVTSPSAWGGVLDDIVSAVDARAANVFTGDSFHEELRSAWLSAELEDFFEHPEGVEVMQAERGLYDVVPEVLQPQQFVSDSVLIEGYNRLGRPPLNLDGVYGYLRNRYGIYHRIVSPLNRQPSYYDFLTLHFGEMPDASRSAVTVEANKLLPHVAKAIEINRPFALLEARYRVVLEVLDRLHLGVILLGEDRSLWLHNEAAARILDNRDSIARGPDGRLRCLAPGTSRGFEAALRRALGESAQQMSNLSRCTRLLLARTNRREPYVAELSPLRQDDLAPLGGSRGLLMVLVDPDHTDFVDVTPIGRLFGLSDAEVAVCELLVLGHSNREIADIRQVSVETVSSQVKSLFAKTDTHRRAELIRLAHSLTIPVASKE